MILTSLIDPKSIQGQILLHRTTFSLGGHLPTTMTLLPRTTAPSLLPPSEDAMDIAADSNCSLHILQFDPERKSPFSLIELQIPLLFDDTDSINRSQIYPGSNSPPPHDLFSRWPSPYNNDAATTYDRSFPITSQRRCDGHSRRFHNTRARNPHYILHRQYLPPVSPLRIPIQTPEHSRKSSDEYAVPRMRTESTSAQN